MLQKLSILNYAIISKVDIDFTEGFTIITGETGAGKSILLGALSLILGQRAEANTLLDKEKKCIIEGIFKIGQQKEQVKKSLHQHEIDCDNDEELIIRREIAVNGKSRAFINDTPVNLSQLKQISSLLVDLHQQFDTLELGEEDFQRDMLDAISESTNDVAQYKILFAQYVQLNKEIKHLKDEQEQAKKTQDYHQFLYNEIAEIHLQPNELENLEEELKLLQNVESIKSDLQQATQALVNNDSAILAQLKQISSVLKSSAQHSTIIKNQLDRLHTCIIELDDIAAELESGNETLQYNPEKLEQINDKLNVGFKLLKKHQVQSTAELLQIKEELEQKIEMITMADEKMSQLEKEAGILKEKIMIWAHQLHQKRVEAAIPFAQNINALLHKVGMPNAVIKIVVEPCELNQFGSSTIDFLFDANKTNHFESIRKVASGGELSRLMLCIKSLVADAIQLPVLIFDEIDTGISGEAARQVGLIMESLATKHQIICITHQAQIAAKAKTHFFVYKSIQGNTIQTSIKALTMEERITTIAQMLSGEKPTAAALQNAREMVGN